jgi:hypothetical protein
MSAGRAALVCAALACTAMAPVLRNGFVIDDSYLIVDNPVLRSFDLPRFFAGRWGGGAGGDQHAKINAAYWRPVTTTVQALEFAAFGLRPWAWHLVSLLLHALAAALAALLVARVVDDPWAALAGGALFALHPVQTEAVAAACYQTTLLAGVLGMAALLTFERRFWLGALLCGLAIMAKEDAAVVPALAAAWILIEKRRDWKGVIAMAAAAAAVLIVRWRIVEPSGITFFGHAPRSTVVLTMIRVAALDVQMWLVPLRLCPFYDWFIVPPETTLSAGVLAGFATILAFGLGLWVCMRRAPRAAVGLAWIALALLPTFHFIPILNVAAERFLYLATVGLAVAFGAFALAAATRRAATAGLVVLLLVLFGGRSFVRMFDWHDDRTLNRVTARDFPETPTPLLNLAQLDDAAGDHAAAEQDRAEARRRAPELVGGH